MAQKSGFFTALQDQNGIYDRKYRASDYTDNLSVIIGNGVLRSDDDDLRVTASGLVVSVGVGRGWINGHYYKNDTVYSFPATSAPVGGTRYDRVMLRLNSNIAARSVSLVYVTGTAAANPVRPSPTRSGNIYDLVLADIYVGTNATTVTVTDKRADADVCGWVYSTSGDGSFFTTLDNNFDEWFADRREDLATVTIFKRYLWETTLTAPTSQISFNIPQYDQTGVNVIDVYVNGIRRSSPEHYSISGNIVTFTNTLIAGTLVSVQVYKSIDGTGIDTVADEITDLQNRVATMEGVANWTYKCTGLNDNISLSQIAKAFYDGSYTSASVTASADAFLTSIGGNTYLSALPTDANITVNVIGSAGVSTPYAGTGTTVDRFKWFQFGGDATSEKHITFDFSMCQRILIWAAGGTENIVFYGTDINVRNVDINARCNAVGCAITMWAGRYNNGNVNFESCRLLVQTTARAGIAQNGNFTNCFIYCSSSDNHALAFQPDTNGFVRLIGGTYYCYCASTQNISAIAYTYAGDTYGVVSAYNINCPQKAVTNFFQTNLCVAYGGRIYINGVTTILQSIGNFKEIVGQISINKR